MGEDIRYPYIVFKIAESLYCVNSKYISTIVQLPPYDKIPAAPENVTGMFRHRDQVIQMLDLRITFGFKTVADEYREFEEMINARKQDHVHWVDILEQSIENEEPFKLATNPHQCALGKWYDSFETTNSSVLFHLRKIEEPHRRLHEAAVEAERCKKDHESCRREQCLKSIFDNVKNEYMPVILSLLDETKQIFRSSIYREMVLLLDGMKWGVVVDEIVAVEELDIIEKREQDPMMEQCSFILNVLESPRREGLIFELNIEALSNKLKELETMF